LGWKRYINITRNQTFGLDIGSGAVKIVALCNNGKGYSAIAGGISEVAAAPDDDMRHRTNTVKAVRSCYARTRIKRKLAVCGVSGPEVAVRDFELPLLSPEEMGAAVALEASQVCPFPADASVVDYQLIHNGTNNTRGILVAAMHSLIADKRHIARDARLKCVMMDVDGLALLNCFQGLAHNGEDTGINETAAILNVGHSHTTLAIADRDRRPLIRDITYAGDEILRQVIEENGTPAETIKEILFGGLSVTELGLGESLAKASRKLISDVNETLRFHTAQNKSGGIEKLYVCGGFALAGGFIELLNKRISVECVLWNPFDRMHCNPNRRYKDIFAKRGPALAVAAGLAMRSIDTDD
jgi:type IV pilus assembly protein PilM